jgi:hypothetical protein
VIVMMLAALAQTAAEPVAEPAVDNEIVVIAQRLRSLRLSPGVSIRKGVVTAKSPCKIKRSSGDAAIDALACDTVALCATRTQPSRKAFNTCVETEAVAAIRLLLAGRRAQDAGEGAEL